MASIRLNEGDRSFLYGLAKERVACPAEEAADKAAYATLHRADAGFSLTQLIARERLPLPSHQIEGGNFRKWAVAVCTAEVKHRERDYLRVEAELGVTVDRWDFPSNDEVGQFPHEAHAGDALLWLSHLHAHESEKRTPWSFVPFCDWRRETRAAWMQKRRDLWAGFLRAVRKYQEARAASRCC